MDPVWYDLAADHGVLELTGPLELHVVQDSETGAAVAWWEDDQGTWLRAAEVGEA